MKKETFLSAPILDSICICHWWKNPYSVMVPV